MCGRITLRTKMNLLLSQFAAEMAEAPDWPARYNVAPTQDVLVLRHPREVVKAHWGLIPSWAKDRKISYSTINARAETVSEKPAFRSAFKSRRCLVPASGLYEWQQLPGGKKQPWHIASADGDGLVFDGLWASWVD